MSLAELVALRHGQSLANAAFAEAIAAGRLDAAVTGPDHQVPLTELGREQARAVGRWLGGRPATHRPTAVVSSPYRRAQETARLILDTAGLPAVPITVDERLGDQRLGPLELMTPAAIAARFPDEWRRRRDAGELDWRPPDGESMRDVIVRVAAYVADLTGAPTGREPTGQPPTGEQGRRIMVVAHDMVLLALRRVVDNLDDDALTELIRTDPPRNAALTIWRAGSGELHLSRYNDRSHLPD